MMPPYAPSGIRCLKHLDYEGFVAPGERSNSVPPEHKNGRLRCAGCWLVWAQTSTLVMLEPDDVTITRALPSRRTPRRIPT
jgi:hypothetical protein